jgi:hypothetical protein
VTEGDAGGAGAGTGDDDDERWRMRHWRTLEGGEVPKNREPAAWMFDRKGRAGKAHLSGDGDLKRAGL